MRVFVAGATGALGKRLVPMLVKAGHDVVGTTRSRDKVPLLRSAGADPVVLDALDEAAVHEAVARAEPEVVVHQLTALASVAGLRNFDRAFAPTNRLRTTALDILLDAARAAGSKRFIAQSFTGWTNPRSGTLVKTEEDPLDPHPSARTSETLGAIARLEATVTGAAGVDGLVLRYGGFYGPGNALSRGGEVYELVRRHRFPIVGSGAGVWSLIHIDDAARATALAVDRGASGVYNIVDDDPAPVADWLPYLAECIGAKRPYRIPGWLARPMIGEYGVALMTRNRGSSNAKAKRELRWELEYSSWRDGFRHGLG